MNPRTQGMFRVLTGARISRTFQRRVVPPRGDGGEEFRGQLTGGPRYGLYTEASGQMASVDTQNRP